MAATIEDVLARRLGIQLYSWRDAIEAAPVVGRVMAEELGWTSEFTRVATADYVGKLNHLLDAAGLSEANLQRSKQEPDTLLH
jgi:glycerol-3-phosphate dehydrogenase